MNHAPFQILQQNIRTFILLAVALVWCGGLLMVRMAWTKSFDYAFLVWNLGLAIAPLMFSSLAILFGKWKGRWVFVFLWLLFLPNAPYIVTDLMHLRSVQSGPIWIDILLLSSCAATGLGLGYCSLRQIHLSFQWSGRPLLGWAVAVGATLLSGFGIYLGRFLRWRSIDLWANPMGLVTDVVERFVNPFLHYRTWGVTLGCGIFFLLGYLWLYFARSSETE